MHRYAALLRGVNLGARNKVAMADLRTLCEGLGCEDVTTYVQSGNVVFASASTPAQLERLIPDAIERDLGLSVTVLVRTASDLARLVSSNPFTGDESDPTKLHVTFLADAPARVRVADLKGAYDGPDAFHVSGRVVYLHTPDGYGRSKLSNAFFEKRLGVAATTRNWKTVTKLAQLARA